ncbi:hypothetical protein ACWC4C_32670 [Streptomyces olivaceoviridis]
MTTTSIAACLGGAFSAQALHREFRHFPAAVDVSGLMTWDDLNTLLATHRLEPPRMRLHHSGPPLPAGDYTEPVTTRRHTVWRRLHPAALHARLADGASLVLDSVDEMHRPLARLAEHIELRPPPRPTARTARPLDWSNWRRRHQAVARHCHYQRRTCPDRVSHEPQPT